MAKTSLNALFFREKSAPLYLVLHIAFSVIFTIIIIIASIRLKQLLVVPFSYAVLIYIFYSCGRETGYVYGGFIAVSYTHLTLPTKRIV